MSDGSPWRPLIHCRDIGRALLAFAQAPAERVHGIAVNVGADEENYQVREIGDLVQELVPDAQIEYTGEIGSDPRSYRVDFGLLGQILPRFRLSYSLRAGAEELHWKLLEHRFSLTDWEGPQFVRLRALPARMELLEPAVR
jgi:nucleoside-diphosphate-sugar epimerase